MAGGATLTVDRVSVRFPEAERSALDGVELAVADGEIVALLGPSGCGKTTLLRVIAGLTVPDAGRVLLDGGDLAGVPVHRRGVGLMFQDYALFPHRDVGQNVEFGLRMAGVDRTRRRARVSETLELVGLPGWERRAVGPLSGGERQRVALARALAPAPRLLLLDEPLGSLDRSLRDRLVPELGTLFREVGVSVVHVTHDQAEALALADRVAVMDQGRVVQAGSPSSVWERPASATVARFLGFANVLDGDGGATLIRPEAVHLRPDLEDGAPPARGADPWGGAAEVVRVLYRGDHYVVTVRMASGGELDALVPSSGERSWRPGERLRVEVDPRGVQRL